MMTSARLSKRQSPTTVLFRTTLTRTATLYELLIVLGSNHLQCIYQVNKKLLLILLIPLLTARGKGSERERQQSQMGPQRGFIPLAQQAPLYTTPPDRRENLVQPGN